MQTKYSGPPSVVAALLGASTLLLLVALVAVATNILGPSVPGTSLIPPRALAPALGRTTVGPPAAAPEDLTAPAPAAGVLGRRFKPAAPPPTEPDASSVPTRPAPAPQPDAPAPEPATEPAAPPPTEPAPQPILEEQDGEGAGGGDEAPALDDDAETRDRKKGDRSPKGEPAGPAKEPEGDRGLEGNGGAGDPGFAAQDPSRGAPSAPHGPQR